MKAAFISTYPPRQCGIGTFTNNLIKAIIANTGHEKPEDAAMVIAISDHDNKYDYPSEVKKVIRQDHQRDYINAAKFINFSDASVAILEHEFGIFGGNDGVYILPLLHRLEIPVIATFHMVMMTFLGFTNLGFKTKNLSAIFAQAAIHVVVTFKNLFKSFNKSIDDFRVVIEERCLDEFNAGVFGSDRINAIIDAVDQNAGKQKIRENDDALETQFYSVFKGRFNQWKRNAGIGGFCPAKAKTFPQHAGNFPKCDLG